MTAIAAILDKGRVYMGGDSAGVADYSLQRRKDAKVFRVGPFLIGYTTSFRMGQILRFHLAPPRPEEGQPAYEYMVKAFVPAVRQCLKENGWATVQNHREEGGLFLVGFRGSLFRVEPDFQVGELLLPFAACGCGSDLVLGALHATPKMEPRRRIRLALEAAEEFSAGVRGPFTVLSL